ncbi:hypothetical protein UNSWDHB_1030 [Dehalobacter sp. UNSWDHB]|nr:hypothetical protein DHBDCA_p630 [Dehalobacter sp. DCA]EQB21646.1 hypothetical protein UNSWDHB_1030 [Dehalobacter sp. UNSWDHB]
MLKAILKVIRMLNFNDVNSVMCRYSVTLVVMKVDCQQ